jgi:Na+-translocating ferredoxin:NAD+ oxidoreductase subunit D
MNLTGFIQRRRQMRNQKKFIVSHAPFWHNGSGIPERSYNIMIAALPAVLMGVAYFGTPALGAISLSIASAIGWEILMNHITRRPVTVGDGHAAMIGMLIGMLMPATAPWWLVIIGTFLAIVIGKQIFGGIGSNPYNPAVLAFAILMVSWPAHLDFEGALVNIELPFSAIFPLSAAKNFGSAGIIDFNLMDLFMGRQVGGIGTTCAPALILGGLYLMFRNFIRWEIVISFLAGIFVFATFFKILDPVHYVGPAFHLLSGYTLFGAIFLATEDSSSPVNFLPMLLYGALAGLMTILIRNIGAYVDGVIFAVLVANLFSPLIDKIRPTALGKAV